MARLLLVILLAIFTGFTVTAQSGKPELASLQKDLKAKLLKHSSVSSVKFNGCEMSAKVVFGRPYRESGYSMGGSVGGIFPADESSNRFSGGMGSVGTGSVQWTKYEFDLTVIDPARAGIVPGRKKNTSIVQLVSADGLHISGNWPAPPPVFGVTVKTKHAAGILSSFQQLARACSRPGI